jgi:hypothetical protein
MRSAAALGTFDRSAAEQAEQEIVSVQVALASLPRGSTLSSTRP